jgi:UDP-3-O-[3-hydroxymyristoyl] glucosamine N-acyltransferase
VKVPQVGGVRIEDRVEIGSNVSIDRGALGDTVIGEGTKIDNLVQIGHGVTIGKHSIIVSQSGLSGSASVGNHTVLAGKVGVSGHVTVGDRIVVMGASVVTKDLEKPGMYAGNPAIPHMKYQRQSVHLRQLPQLQKRVKALEGMEHE